MANERKDKTLSKAKGSTAPSLADLVKEFRKASKKENSGSIEKSLKKQTVAIEGWISSAEKSGTFNKDTSRKIADGLRKSTEAINTGNLSADGLNLEFAKLEALQKESLAFSKNPQKKYEKISATMLGDLSQQIEKQTQIIEADNASIELGNKIKDLQKTSLYQNKETSTMLADTYAEYSKQLEDAIGSNNEKSIAAASKQLEELAGSTESEEKRREAAKANDEQTDIFLNMQAALEKTAESVGKLGQGAVKGVGFLAGLAGMFLMFTDPEKFAKIMMDVMNIVSDIFSGIILIFQGDLAGGLKKFEGHGLAIAGIIAGLAAYFAGPIIGAFASIFGVLSKVVKALQVVRLFMMGTLIPGIMATFTAIFGAMAPFVLIGLAIAAIVGLLMFAVKNLGGFDSYGDMFAWAIAGMKDAFAMVVNLFIGVINGIIGFVDKYGGALARMLGFDMPDLSQYKLEEMATDNLEKVNAKQAAEKVERDKKKESEDAGTEGIPAIAASQQPDAEAVQPLTPLVQQPDVEVIPGQTLVQRPDVEVIPVQALGIQTLPPIEIQGVQTQPALGVPPVNTGDALNNMSRDNDASNKAAVSNVSQVISQTSNAPTSNSTVTNIMQMPTSRASMTLASISSR